MTVKLNKLIEISCLQNFAFRLQIQFSFPPRILRCNRRRQPHSTPLQAHDTHRKTHHVFHWNTLQCVRLSNVRPSGITTTQKAEIQT